MGDADADLLARLRAGDEAAFVTLVRRYQPPLLRLAQSLVGNASVAEEAVQDTWLAIVSGIEGFEGRSTLKTWLFRILVNRARSAGGREHATEALPDEIETPVPDAWFNSRGGWAAPPEAWAEAADERALAKGLAKRVFAYLEQLPPRQRQVVLLRDVEGLSSSEVCRVLGVNDNHGRVLLHRGRAAVRRLLAADLGSA